MGCCNDDKPKGESIPNIKGELKITNMDGTVDTIFLDEKEIWLVRAALKDTLNRALNEPGFANGEAKAALVTLVEKMVPKQEGCGSSCGCGH